MAHTPTVVGDSVYLGSCNGMFRRLDLSSGKVRWETNVRGAAERYFFHGDVFVAPDRVIASADVDPTTGAEAGVHAFDRESGRELWKHAAGRGVLGTVTSLENRVFAYVSTGDLIALDVATGQREWGYEMKAPPWESPAGQGNRVYAGSSDGTMYAFESGTGRVVWRRNLESPISTSVRAAAARVYVGTADGVMHRLAANSGEQSAALKVDDILDPVGAPWVGADTLVILLVDQTADYRAMVAMDRGLTRVLWRAKASDKWTTSRVFVARQAVFVGSPTGEVSGYCLKDGSLAWSQKFPVGPIRSIGGSDEVLLAGTTQGSLFAVRTPRSCG